MLGHGGMDAKTKELAPIALLACLALALAWRRTTLFRDLFWRCGSDCHRRGISSVIVRSQRFNDQAAVQHKCRIATFDDNTVMMFYLPNLQR
jgi:hypothetical protein